MRCFWCTRGGISSAKPPRAEWAGQQWQGSASSARVLTAPIAGTVLLSRCPAVVRYHKGEFYHEHYDNRADGPLTRAATILVYLCDTEEGGATRWAAADPVLSAL